MIKLQENENLNKNVSNDSLVKKGVLGFLIGLAIIVPGVSGSTISIIFKLYEKIMHAIANFIKEFKLSIIFLAPIAIGAVIGLITGFLTIQKLIDIMPFAIISLFAGLMLGAVPSLKDEIKEEKYTKKNILFISIGILIPLIITGLSIFLNDADIEVESKLIIDFKSIIMYILIGFIIAATQFIPGASSTAILMALGYFTPLLNSISFSYITQNPSVLLVYIFIGIGGLIGLAVLSKLINKLINKYKTIMYFVFIGLSLGSVLCLFINVDMLTVYNNWMKSNAFPFLDLILGVGLFICGTLISYQLVRYIRNKNKV